MTLHEKRQAFSPQDLDGSLSALPTEEEDRKNLLKQITLALEANDPYAIALVKHALGILEEAQDETVITEEQIEQWVPAKLFFRQFLGQHVMAIPDVNLRTRAFRHLDQTALEAILEIIR